MNIVILAAGNDDVHSERADEYPLFLSEIDGEMLVEHLVRKCQDLAPARLLFAVKKEHLSRHHVDDIIRLMVPDAAIVEIAGHTMGAVCTALLLVDYIDLEDELLILNASDFVDADLSIIIQNLRDRGADGGTIIFDSLHPRYSFARLDPEGYVVEVAEKRPISRNATAGCYWYRSAQDFLAASERMIIKDAHVNGQFYVSQTFNEMVLENKVVLAERIDASQYHPVKSSRQVATLESILEHLRGIDAI